MNENTAPAALPDLLPCPVCGKPAELHHRHDDPDGFVVFCEDLYCAGNCVPEFDTKEAACAAWNDPARRADFRWYKSCCPNCGWSEADEQGFSEYLEHQQNLPAPPLWQRILRRIASGPVYLSDCYYFLVLFSLFEMFSRTFAFFGIEAGFSFDKQLIIATIVFAPVILSRFLLGLYSDYKIRKELDHAFQ